MIAKDIITRRFEKATFNGYKTEDVDDFLREVSNEFSQLQKEKNELERKLEVLADKIREYRDDEDALKDALLIAQKQANQMAAEAKAAAEKLKKQTDETVAKQLSEATAKADALTKKADEYSKRMTRESNEAADKLVKEARAKAEEIHTMMQRQTEIQQTILQKTRKEADEYRNRLITSYKAHIDFIEKLPEKCENDFVKATAEEVEKREAERAKAAKAQKTMPQPAPAPKQEEKAPATVPAAEKSSFKVNYDDAPANPFAGGAAESSTEELPFFNPSSEKKTQHDDLQFGKRK